MLAYKDWFFALGVWRPRAVNHFASRDHRNVDIRNCRLHPLLPTSIRSGGMQTERGRGSAGSAADLRPLNQSWPPTASLPAPFRQLGDEEGGKVGERSGL
jgi:hypothetical protein